jgi:regulator of nonsense transcripts 2
MTTENDKLNDCWDTKAEGDSHNEQKINENDKNELETFIKERNERTKQKLQLRDINKSSDLHQSDQNLGRLDSSIKKVTSFIKKLKTLTESQYETLSKELVQLNLSKYLSEVAAAFVEVKLKMNDIQCALKLCSTVHQLYPEFSQCFFEQWQKVLNVKKEEKVANPSKMRVDMRFFAELITIGILPEKEALSLLGNQLTILTMYDKDHANISIISSFCKNCGEDFAGLITSKYIKLSEKYDIKIPRIGIFKEEKQTAVRNLFKEYYKTLTAHLLREHAEVQKLERNNQKMYETKGEVANEKKEKYEQCLVAYKKLIEHTEFFADILNEPMPHLPVDVKKKEDDLLNIDIYMPSGRPGDDFDSTNSPWEDEDTRQFYECIPDLKVLVPAILYKDSESKIGEDKEKSQQQNEDTTTKDQDDDEDLDSKLAEMEKEIESYVIDSESNQITTTNELDSQQETSDDKELAVQTTIEEASTGPTSKY